MSEQTTGRNLPGSVPGARGAGTGGGVDGVLPGGQQNEHSEAVKTPDDVKREMGLGWWESMLLWTCKADIYALRMSTYETRLQFQGFGILVLLTAMLACGSMWFALHSTIFAGNPIGALFAAAIYATAIFFIEREIVDPAKEGWIAAALRGVMATIIALVISFPFEAEILKEPIDDQIKKSMEQTHAHLFEERKQINQLADKRLADQSKELLARMDSYKSMEAILLKELDAERQRGYFGPKSERHQARIDDLRSQSAEVQKQLLQLQRQRLTDSEAARLKEVQKTIDDAANKKTDPLSRLMALNAIGKEHPEASYMSWLLRIFFITLELMPAMMKVLAPKTEYSFYVAGRRALNQAKINSSINFVIEHVKENPQATWRELRQVLDLIEHGIEDRSTRPGRSLAEIAASMRSASSIPPIGNLESRQASDATQPQGQGLPPPGAA